MPIVIKDGLRVRPDNEEFHQEDFLWTIKSYQELSRFTDITLYCLGGRRISAHREVLCKLSPFLEELFERQSCCSCYGHECSKGRDNFGVSLVGFDLKTVERFLEIIYTGRTFFTTQGQQRAVEALLRSLKIRIPSNAFSLITDHETGEERPIRFNTGHHEESYDEYVEDEDEEVEEIEFDQTQSTPQPRNKGIPPGPDGKKQCPKCFKSYPLARGWYKRHRMSKCPLDEGEILDSIPDDIDSSDELNNESFDIGRRQPRVVIEKLPTSQDQTPATYVNGKKKCPKCGKFYDVAIGWYKRHRKFNCPLDPGEVDEALETQDGEALQDTYSAQDPAATEIMDPVYSSDGKKQQCPICYQFISLAGGRFSHHYLMCRDQQTSMEMAEHYDQGSRYVQDNTDDVIGATSGDTKECPKCLRMVSISGGWYVKHVRACDGDPLGPNVKHNSKQCPKCLRFITMASGWYKRHSRSCGGTAAGTEATESIMEGTDDSSENLICKFCSTAFESWDIWEFQNHQILCGQQNHENETDFYESGEAPVETSASSAQGVICFSCQANFATKAKLKMHVVNHYRNEMRSKFGLDSNTTNCPFNNCLYSTSRSEHMLVHVALTHNQLRNFMPSEEAEFLFPSRPAQQQSNNTEKKRSFAKISSSPTNEDRTSILVCNTCELQFFNRSLLKQHLVVHHKQAIRRQYISSDKPDRCSICLTYGSDKPDNLIQHIALTHRKLKDYLPPSLSKELFTDSTAPTPAKRRKIRGIKAKTRTKTKAKAAGSSAKGDYTCLICSKSFTIMFQLKMHMCKHFIEPLKELIGPEGLSQRRCALCDSNVPSESHAVFHLGSKHDYILKVVDEDVLKYLESKRRQPSAGDTPTTSRPEETILANGHAEDTEAEPEDGEVNDEEVDEEEDNIDYEDIEEVDEEGFQCSKCQESFPSQSEYTAHIDNDQCNNETVPNGTKGCHLCDETFKSFIHYRSHLLVHFEEALEKELEPIYESLPENKCQDCGYKAKTLAHYVRHVAIEHNKVLACIPDQVLLDLSQDFGIDPDDPPTSTSLSASQLEDEQSEGKEGQAESDVMESNGSVEKESDPENSAEPDKAVEEEPSPKDNAEEDAKSTANDSEDQSNGNPSTSNPDLEPCDKPKEAVTDKTGEKE